MPTILVIDDDDQIRGMIRQILSRDGYDVVEAADGKQGAQLFRQNPTDLVISDLIMPEKEGIETILELRKENPAIKIIAISGGGRVAPDVYLEEARILGAHLVLKKPFERQELLEAVRKLLKS